MRKILAVIFLNFIQGLRERIFLGVVFFFIFLLGLTFFLSILSVGESAAVTRSAGLSAMEISGLFLVIFGFTFSFYNDKTSRMIEVYLTFFSRYVYTAGKLCSFLLIAFFYLILAGIFWVIILIINGAFFWQSWLGILSIFLKLSIALSLNLLFSCLFSSPIFALLCTLFIYASGEIASQALKAVIIYFKSPISLALFKTLKYILPNLDKIDLKYQLAYAQVPNANFLVSMFFYTFCYCLFLWILSTRIFIINRS
jgi:hypothetical protein